MIWKCVGALLIIGAAVYMGHFIASECKRKLQGTEEALALVKYIRRNIEAYLSPIGDILKGYSSEYLEECGFAHTMRETGLACAVEEGYLDLPIQAKRALWDFASSLGSGYAEAELKHCDYCIAMLEEVAASEREKLTLNGRLYRFLPPIGALSLIILLI